MMQSPASLTGIPVPPAAEEGPPVIVVMAVFRPDPAHLRAQLASIAAQSHRNLRLLAIIADTTSGPAFRAAANAAGLGGALAITPDAPLDAVRAFERGLTEALRLIETTGPAGNEALIALSDQDDIWHPDRLARGIARLAGSPLQLVHSDARLVAADGTTVTHPSLFRHEGRQRAPRLRDLLGRNTVTGMTALLRPRLAALALPFPQQAGIHFYHDLWLALLAEATGGIGLIDAPLVDYRQHGNNAVGALSRRSRPRRLHLPGRAWLRQEAARYGLARYLAQSLRNRLAETDAGAEIAPLRPFHGRLGGVGAHLADAARLALAGHGGPARIAAGFAIVSLGRSVWALREALGAGLGAALEGFDARLYSLSPGHPPRPPRTGIAPERPPSAARPTEWWRLVDNRKRPAWAPAFTEAAPALVVLVPTLNPTEIFAGVATAIDIGLGLARRGLKVRFVATDLPISSPAASRSFLRGRAAEMEGGPFAERVALQCGVTARHLPAHRGDIFLATAWWTAHVADELVRDHAFARKRFLYLIQDFEPDFYAWGPEYADAMASYGFDFDPIFNTTLLRDHFRAQGFAFAGRHAPAFQPAIDIARHAGRPRSCRPAGGPRRVALYGRPEVPRNMYATGIEALARFLRAETIAPGAIELVSVGLAHPPVALPGGHVLTSLGKLPWDAYPDFLLGTDIGLSLMYSPHPSHPPLEMAASGVRVVTNRFGPKDLGALSPAIESVAPTAPALAEALARAWRASPPAPEARHLDLARLGLPIGALLDILTERLQPVLSQPEHAQ